jgi:hypothetical protein
MEGKSRVNTQIDERGIFCYWTQNSAVEKLFRLELANSHQLAQYSNSYPCLTCLP